MTCGRLNVEVEDWALNRRDDDAGARRVEHRNGGRLVTARVGERVVAHDRRLRQRAVDAPVDTREAGRDLVDNAVEVVDPRLQRDGEVDEVLLAAAEEDELRRAY